jgi:hypothetical protein
LFHQFCDFLGSEKYTESRQHFSRLHVKHQTEKLNPHRRPEVTEQSAVTDISEKTPLIWHLRAPHQGSRWVDLFLFLRLKSIMKGACFTDVAAIQERVTKVLQSIPKEAFADSFQKLYKRCQQCVVKECDYFEGQ